MAGLKCWTAVMGLDVLEFELKRLFKGSVVYGLGGVLQKFLGFLLLPLFTRFLQPEEYGVAALVGLFSVAVSGLFNLGTGNSLGILYFKEKDADRRPESIWTNVFLLLFWGAFLYAVLYVAAPYLSLLMFQTKEYSSFFRITLLSLFCSTVTTPLSAYLRMEEQAKTYVFITLIGMLVSMSVSVYLVVVLHWGVMGTFVAGVVSNCFSLLFFLFFVIRQIPFTLNIHLVKPLVRIGFPSIWGVFAFMIIDYADRQMIERMLGLDTLGIYSIGYSFGMVMLIFVDAFALSWPPFFMSFVSRRAEAQVIFGKVLKYYLLVYGFLVIAFFGFARPVLILMSARPYWDAFVVVGIVAAAYMLKGAYLIVLPGFSFEERLGMRAIIEWLAAVVNIVFNFLLIPHFGIVGAAVATLACYIVLFMVTTYFSQRFLVVNYERTKILGYISVLVGFALIIFSISRYVVSPIIIISLTIFMMTMLMLFSYFFVLEEQEQRFAFAKIQLVRQWIRK